MSEEDKVTVSLVVASRLMELKRSWTWELLSKRQKANPHKSILLRSTERGRYRVNVDELAKIIREANSVDNEFLIEKVETLESEVSVLRRRILRIERESKDNSAA